MQKFFRWLDETGQISRENKTISWLERIAFVFLALMMLTAPHSIAASQISWLCGMLAWALRLLFRPRPAVFKTPLNLAFLLFGVWSVISAVFSYAPDISIDKLRSVSLFLVFFFVINNLRSRRAAAFLSFVLIGSCFVSAAWSPFERIIGRGIEVQGINAESPLAKANLKINVSVKDYIEDGDTIIRIDKKKISSPEQLVSEIEKNDVTPVTIYRPDYDYIIEVRRTDLLSGGTALERLGVQNWKPSHNWRSAGFYGHYTTYSEVLQLIASLTLGVLVGLLRRKGENSKERNLKIIFGVCLATLLFALLLTVTRASQAAFMLSAAVIVLLGASRKMIVAMAVFAIPLILLGAFLLSQTRHVGFYDQADNSITWRQTVYREAINLATASPRHLLIGVGMDSIKRYAKEWHLFDDGKLPTGHFHSTPLQLAVERGIPALLIWLLILGIYAKTLWNGLTLKSAMSSQQSIIENGIILGCFGGLVGFFTSGLVHYNLGDGEVAMVFYALMGIGVFLSKYQESPIIEKIN